MIKPIPTLDGYEVAISSPSAFTGETENTRGDSAGTDAAHTLFQVNGDVIARVFGVCTVDLAGSGTLTLGVTGSTACFIASTTAADLEAGDIWVDASPAEVSAVALTSIPAVMVITNGKDILETTGTADITAGQIYYVCMWRPLTPGSSVVALPIQEGADIRGY